MPLNAVFLGVGGVFCLAAIAIGMSAIAKALDRIADAIRDKMI
jgi:hypothetical protein